MAIEHFVRSSSQHDARACHFLKDYMRFLDKTNNYNLNEASESLCINLGNEILYLSMFRFCIT